MVLERTIDKIHSCAVCKEDLVVFHEVSNTVDRLIACDRKDGKRHVCFDLPQDANLIVLED